MKNEARGRIGLVRVSFLIHLLSIIFLVIIHQLVLQVWDSRSRDGVKRTIGGPHICGDGLDIQGYNILTGA